MNDISNLPTFSSFEGLEVVVYKLSPFQFAIHIGFRSQLVPIRTLNLSEPDAFPCQYPTLLVYGIPWSLRRTPHPPVTVQSELRLRCRRHTKYSLRQMMIHTTKCRRHASNWAAGMLESQSTSLLTKWVHWMETELQEQTFRSWEYRVQIPRCLIKRQNLQKYHHDTSTKVIFNPTKARMQTALLNWKIIARNLRCW